MSIFNRINNRLRYGKGSALATARYIVLDTELTGLNKNNDEIIAIGAVRMLGGHILMGESYYQLVKPSKSMRSENILVHHLTPTELANAPAIETVIRQFADFVGNDTVIGHFVNIDMGFLRREAKRYLPNAFNLRTLDTAQTMNWISDMQQRYLGASESIAETSLYAQAERLGIDIGDEHNALYDAFITAQVWQRAIVMLEALGVTTTDEL
jgi:DNA polymerase-3 subunit epsilon